MNAISMNNLWTYLQGLSLTADNWRWLAERTSQMSMSVHQQHATTGNKKYRLSPKNEEAHGQCKNKSTRREKR